MVTKSFCVRKLLSAEKVRKGEFKNLEED